MSCRYDIIFAGAGLSALSLAVRLAALPTPPRMLLVDPRMEAVRDRTWCHWRLHADPFEEAITHSWHRWTVRANGQPAATAVHRIPYVRIPADSFHRLAMEKIQACPHVELRWGVSVESLAGTPNHAIARLSDNRCVEAAWAFDTRPPSQGRAPWRQVFRGLELRAAEANIPTDTVTLMDFRAAGAGGIRFFYLLPLDPHTALVEDTWLVPAGASPTFTDDDIIAHAVANLHPGPWTILHREEGDIPMGLPMDALPVAEGPCRVIRWGTAAGAVRASSGYAFSRIQRASDHMAAHWREHGGPSTHPTHGTALLAWMDRVFLRVMERHPARVPDFFHRLFTRVPPDSLVRFLESVPRRGDILRVMGALPPAPFLASALR